MQPIKLTFLFSYVNVLFLYIQSVSAHLKQILEAESTPDSASNEKIEKSKNMSAATSEEEMAVDQELFPSTSHKNSVLKDTAISQPDDRSVQIKAGKAEVKSVSVY